MPDIEVEVFDGENPTSLVGTLSGTDLPNDGKSFERGFLDQSDDVGSGSLKVHASDPALGTTPSAPSPMLKYRNIFLIKVFGEALFAWFLENRAHTLASAQEASDDVWELSGRGVMALLEKGDVYPETMADPEFAATVTGSTVRQRQFNWTAIKYDDSNWSPAVEIQRQGDAGPEERWAGVPTGWPDPNAVWIWSRGEDNDFPAGKMPVGKCYFRQSFTVDPAFDGMNGIFYCVVDNKGTVYYDGEQILEPELWGELASVTKILTAGVHEIAILGENTATDAQSQAAPGGPAGVLFTGFVLDDTGNISDGLIQSNGAWKALDYPDAVPGMTIGQIMRILLEEEQGRGGLPGITWDFSDAAGSDAEGWTAGQLLGGVYTVSIALEIGEDLLEVAKTFTEQYVEMWMDPDLTLHMVNKGNRGRDLTGSVELKVSVGQDPDPPHIIEWKVSGVDQGTNVILARDTTGVLTEVSDAESLAKRPRSESYLEIAAAPDEETASQMSGELLVEFSYPTGQVSGEVTLESGVYAQWRPGDIIKGPNLFRQATPTRILSVMVGEDADTGRVTFKPQGLQYDLEE